MRKYSSECPDTFVYCWSRNNGEWYYGVHTGSLDDGYIGSGTYQVQICDRYVGCFETQEEAEAAYEREKLKVWETY